LEAFMKKLAIALISVLGTVTAACGSDDKASSSGTSGTPAATNEFTVKSNEFSPKTLSVKVGDTVTWKWAGGIHNVVSGANCTPDNSYTSGPPNGTVGNTFTHVYDKAGTYEFHCNPHCASSGMKGTVTVQ
jgi:plastocyanin